MQEQVRLSKKILSNIPIIRNMPLFLNSTQQELEHILQYSHIGNYKKGLILFLKGEKALNFYIIISGLVETFDSNDLGEELIINIMGSKKMICANTMMLDSDSLVNAKIIKDAEILCIPAIFLKEYIKNNNNLKNNILSNLIDQSSELTTQLGALNLKDAKARIGCFLLDLFLRNNKETIITLPYSKFIIASYLGMRSETFSRSLEKLEKEGITFNKNQVTLSDEFTICKYCDLGVADKIKKYNATRCHNCIYDTPNS